MMGALSAIEWTTHTFNPWWGCTKVGPGCDHCYAETFDRRVGGAHWGSGQPRRLVKDWSGPRKWNAAAERSGERPWVFCASMADVFDNEVDPAWRERLWDLVRECRNLRWQFVTKRIGNAAKLLPADWTENFGHCGLIATVVNQAEADRDIPKLVATPAAWRGISAEPLLGPILFDLKPSHRHQRACAYVVEDGPATCTCNASTNGLDWVIVGGESGSKAREFHTEWGASIVAQCAAAGVPCFVKQLGDRPMHTPSADVSPPQPFRASKKGKDMAEWPAALRVREMPKVYAVPAPLAGAE